MFIADESESESEASDVNTSDEEDSSWISWFCTLKVGLRAKETALWSINFSPPASNDLN